MSKQSFDTIHVYTDGSSHGNPGPASYAALFCDDQDEPISDSVLGFANPVTEYIGEATNNVAEYRGIIQALNVLSQLSVHSITMFSDSELVVRQITGRYKVKNEGLQPLYREAKALVDTFSSITFNNVRRDHPNIHICDRAANALTDSLTGRTPRSSNPEPKATPTADTETEPIRVPAHIARIYRNASEADKQALWQYFENL